MKQSRVGMVVVLMLLCCSLFGQAQQTGAASANAVVPTLVSFSGVLTGSNGKPLTTVTGVTFSLYAEQEGGAPLWLETQNVQPDKNGNYTVQLGATTSQGLPSSLFVSGQARWLEVQAQGQDPQARIMLLSVPYALKAGDAQTLGGQPASSFMLAPATGQPGASPASQATNITGSGTKDYLAIFTGKTTIGNSQVYQNSSGDIGIGTTSPTATLDVKGEVIVASTAAGTAALAASSTASLGLSGSGASAGVYGTSTTGTGVDGSSTSGAGMTGTTNSGIGVYGASNASDGVYGQTNSTSASAYGVYGLANSTSATGAGVFGQSNSANANGVVGQGANGVAGTSTASTGSGGLFTGWSAPSGSGQNGGVGTTATGGAADPTGGTGGTAAGDGLDAYGGNSGYKGSGDYGGFGVVGQGGGGDPEYGGDGAGGVFTGGDTSAGGDGVYAQAGSGYAGYLQGDVNITGSLSKGGGSFKIDHPLDPANKYLYHSFVESPDMMNVYNGNVVLDANGEAVVDFPEWFGVLNRDFRYQLTCIGGFAPVYVAEKVSNNHFKIAGGKPGLEVSWQVTGIRQDAWANAHRIPVEEEKEARLKGFYIHPELYGAPPEKQIEWARHPQMMKKVQQVRQAQQQRRQAAATPAAPVTATLAAK